MSLLDNILGSLTNGNGQQNPLGELQAIWNWVQEQGGVEALIQKFQHGGLGEILSSWLSNGGNQAISSQDIQSAFAQSELQSLAEKLGTDVNGASSKLSVLLPQLVDKISPQGEIHSQATGGQADLGSLVDSIFKR